MIKTKVLIILFLIHTAFAGENLVKEGLGEFAGGSNIPFPHISENAIKTFAGMVNTEYGMVVLDRRKYAAYLEGPSAITLAPADNDRYGNYNMLVVADQGAPHLVHFDSHPDHVRKDRGYEFAAVGMKMLYEHGTITNIVSNYIHRGFLAGVSRKRDYLPVQA